MELLLVYTDRLRSMGLIDEMHIWDYSRNKKDEEWLSDTFGRSNLVKTHGYNYKKVPVFIKSQEEKKVFMRGRDNAHVLLSCGGKDFAEIALGTYRNSFSFLRDKKQGKNLCHHRGKACEDGEWVEIGIRADADGTVVASRNDEEILRSKLNDEIRFPLEMSLSGWNNSPTVEWMLRDRGEEIGKHPYASVFKAENKSSFEEYYLHYTEQAYKNSVIIKSDDDIVFIDTGSFGEFVNNRLADPDSILHFPSIVNHGACAFHQQKHGLIDKSMGIFSHDTSGGRLLGDGRLCAEMHRQFAENIEDWIRNTKKINEDIKIPIGQRFSINFFAILSKDLNIYRMIRHEVGADEEDITMLATRALGRQNLINMRTTVSHLSFRTQRTARFDEEEVISLYSLIASNKNTTRPKIRIRMF